MNKQPITDGDYALTDGAAWLEVKNFSIRVCATDEGVSVDIYRNGDETEGAVASTYAYDSEVEGTPSEREDHFRDDVEADADALASAGYGTDEDYGHYGGDEL